MDGGARASHSWAGPTAAQLICTDQAWLLGERPLSHKRKVLTLHALLSLQAVLPQALSRQPTVAPAADCKAPGPAPMPERRPLPPGPRPGLAALSRAPGWQGALPSLARRQWLQRQQSTLTTGQQPLPCGLTHVRLGMEIPRGWPATHVHP